MNQFARISCATIGIFLSLTSAGCEISQTDAEQLSTIAKPRNISQRQHGLTTTAMGTVISFSYNQNLPLPYGAAGCQFVLDAYPARTFFIGIDLTALEGGTADAMCRMALDSLQSGSQITLTDSGTDEVRSMSVAR